MADRYWVGGTGTWNTSNTTNWSDTSGGSGGFSVPTSSDNVFINSASSSGSATITVSGTVSCANLTTTNYIFSIAGTSAPIIQIYGNFTSGSSTSWNTTNGPAMQFLGGTAATLTSSGRTLRNITINKDAGVQVQLGDALTLASLQNVVVTQGTFTTNNYAVTAGALSSANSNTRTINLGSSTVTLSGGPTIVNFSTNQNLTFNAGTSSIVITAGGTTVSGGAFSTVTFYDVSFTSTSASAIISQPCIFNNLSFAGRASAGVGEVVFTAGDQTINGTLTFSAGTDATCRMFVRSNAIGTTRTLTCAAVASLTDIDFRDITIAGAAAPVSGTRLGDCKGNSGITFGAGKTVYWNLAGNNNWSATAWATSSGGSVAVANFPLAQDTAIFTSTSPATGATTTVNAAYNIGTIDMSARTSNTMTLATSTNSPSIYGNWINGTGVSFSGNGNLIYAGRGSQTITSAGRTFTQQTQINSPAGTVTLQDAFISSVSSSNGLVMTTGTFDANGYNFTLSAGGVAASGSGVRALGIGTGTWTIGGGGVGAFVATTSTNLTVTGTGTISLTSTSGKTFAGGGIQTYPTINQGGTGTLTITGSNKFANITNTAIGRVQFTGGTTNEFTAFNLNGILGNLLQVGSTNTTQVTLKAPSWNVGIASTDGGNNTGLSFTGLSPNFLNISYVIGVVTSAPTSTIYYGSTNVTVLYYGSSPVTAVYYGSTQVF